MSVVLDILSYGPLCALMTLLLLALVLNEGERRGRRQATADLRARAHARLAQHEALPWDEEGRR